MSGYSGGDGSGIDLTARLGLVANTFNDLLNNAQAIKGLGFGFVDEFTDETGIDTATSTNENYDAVNDLYNNLAGFSADVFTGGAPTVSGASVGTAASVFDGLTADGWFIAGTPWVKYDLGAGITKTITKIRMFPGTNGVDTRHNAFTFAGSNDDTTYTTLLSSSDPNEGATPTWREHLVTNTTAYRYYKLTINSFYGSSSGLAELEGLENLPPVNMTLVSNAWSVTAAVNTGQFIALLEPVDPVTLGTDFAAEISADGGTTWVACPLTDYGDFSTGIKIVAGDATFATSGTSLVAKIVSANTKQFKLHGWSVLGG